MSDALTLQPLSPEALAQAVRAELDHHPHAKGAFVLSATTEGARAVIAHKTASGWEIQGVIELKGWQQAQGGLEVVKTW